MNKTPTDNRARIADLVTPYAERFAERGLRLTQEGRHVAVQQGARVVLEVTITRYSSATIPLEAFLAGYDAGARFWPNATVPA